MLRTSLLLLAAPAAAALHMERAGLLAREASEAFEAAAKFQDSLKCEQEDVSFAVMSMRICTLNWVIMGQTGPNGWKDTNDVGCWKLKAYNTDEFLSSGWYQNTNGECALIFSGYHGKLVGYTRATLSLAWPPVRYEMCGNKMYAPYVRLLRHHTTLGNWSKIMNGIAGPQTTCKGGISLAAESMGGSSLEIMASCAALGELRQLQNASLPPSFPVKQLYTFGAPAASVRPIKNPLSESGCWKGKRIFQSSDYIARLGSTLGPLKHPYMEALEIQELPEGISHQEYSCKSKGATNDGMQPMPPADNRTRSNQQAAANMVHEVTEYAKVLTVLAALPKGQPGEAAQLAQ